LGTGDGSFQAPQSFALGSFPWAIAAGDLNNDGLPDLAAASSGSNDVSVLLGNGDGTFQPRRIFGAGNGPASVAEADFNGDGLVDLAVANYLSNNVSILINNMRPSP
jgi:hypothetical protein